jgi:SAM-dependent methyltransferase
MNEEKDVKMNQKREHLKERARWEQRYVDDELPWDSGKPDLYLRRVIEEHSVKPGKALEIGCGTGTNLIWLAEHGFTMTGLDLSQTAIAKAEAKVAVVGVNCRLFNGDFLVDQVPGAPFEFVYDRGCWHSFDGAEERSCFASRVGNLLAPEGMWHSLIGSTDGPPRDTGPPRRSAAEIALAVEPHFEILELRSTLFDQENHNQARAWVLVARRRVFYPTAV